MADSILTPDWQDDEYNVRLYHGDCEHVLSALPDASVDSIVTDPPYGLSFMGKGWDHGVPGVEVWRECLRVLKPGGHLLAFGGTRTQHRLVVAIEDAGFEVRDMIAWVYGQGFPKSKAVGNGWGTALKPAMELISMARKPFGGTVAANVLAHGTGAINVDGCRVGMDHGDDGRRVRHGQGKDAGIYGAYDGCDSGGASGRWPSNFIHDGSPEVVGLMPETNGKYGMTQHGSGTNSIYGTFERSAQSFANDGTPDSGSAARFFYCPKASKQDRDEGLEGCPLGPPPGSKRSKPAPGRAAALGAPRRNTHNTVKPIDLMQYLCRLVTPPGGIVLDPFMGSGSTGKAARREGFGFVGIELERESFDIAVARVGHECVTERGGALFAEATA